MKKKIFTIITVLSMLVPTAAVFAANAPTLDDPTASVEITEPQIQGDVMLLDGDMPVEDDFTSVVVMPSYIRNTVTVTAIDGEKIETVLEGQDKENFDNVINYTILDETRVFGMANGEEKSLEDVKVGDTITVFTNGYAPAPLMLPPQYQANVIMVNDNMEISSLRFCDVDTYVKRDGALVNLANTLELELGEETKITGLVGRMTTIDELENKDLLVVYSMSTKSIPAKTSPIAITVLGENEQALAQLNAPVENEPEETQPEETASPEVDFTKIKDIKVNNEIISKYYIESDGTVMLPLRKIAETFGFSVEWDGENRTVLLNSGMYSLQIGVNSYIKGRMVPVALKAAPYIKEDLTYVPVEYFTEILEAAAVVENDVYTLTLTDAQ